MDSSGPTTPIPTIERIAIVGAGLVGGSIAAAARRAGLPRVVLTDADPGVRERAAELDLADEVVADVATAVGDVDLVIAAVPTHAVAEVLVQAAAAVSPGTILTDAASLKARMTVDVESRLRSVGYDVGLFVGGHPMAGSERSGPDAADASLFQAATWVLTPTSATADGTLHELTSFLRRLGARVVALPPQRHDELVAIVSHLPQVVASTLADVASEAADEAGDAILAIAGGGFRDTTRVAASDPDLWVGILDGNRDAVLEGVDAFAARLEMVRGALAAGDTDALRTWLGRASLARRRLVPKTVADGEESLVDLVVALDDRPGQLALATTALGGAGVNIEDLAMRHASEGRRGALLLRVASPDVDDGISALREVGLVAHADSDLRPGGDDLRPGGDDLRPGGDDSRPGDTAHADSDPTAIP